MSFHFRKPFFLIFLILTIFNCESNGNNNNNWWNPDYHGKDSSEDYDPLDPDVPSPVTPSIIPNPNNYPQLPYHPNGQGVPQNYPHILQPPVIPVPVPMPTTTTTTTTEQPQVPLIPLQPQPTMPPLKMYTPFVLRPPSFITEGRRRSRNSKGKQTVIPVGDLCDITDPTYNKCIQNAECVLFEMDNLYKCNCSFAYDVTSGKKCLRSFGQYCDVKDPCNHEAFLSCVNNRCECENSEVYQRSGEKCRSKVGGPCNTGTGPDCISNAVCLSFDRYGRHSRCVCKDGYVETLSGLCASGVGMPCHGKGECNPEIPLVCKEGICSCREAVHIYDPETNSCVGLIGAQCCTNFDGVDCPQGVTNGCVSGAFCKKPSRNTPGRCSCQSYNLESDERTCTPNPAFGQMVTGKVY